MNGITYTPGTFNPVGTLVELPGVFVFPKVPAKTLLKLPAQYQWNSLHEDEESEARGVVSVERDYTSGQVKVGVVSGVTNDPVAAVQTAGVRYIPDSIHAVAGRDVGEQAFLWQLPEELRLAPSGGVLDLGTVVVEYGGDFELPSNSVILEFNTDITVEGADAPDVYQVKAQLENHSGGIVTDGFPHLGNAANDYPPTVVEGTAQIDFRLNIGNLVVDQFTLAIPVRAAFEFQLHADVMVPGASLPIPRVTTGLTITDTLYGKGAATTPVNAPTVPQVGYRRTSRVEQGDLTIL